MFLARCLLWLYPKSFREEYAGEIALVYRHEGLGRAVLDTLWNAPAAHLDLLRQDVRAAFGSWRAGFALTVIGVTALGIAATTAAFTVADHTLLRPLPFPEPERLVRLYQGLPGYRMELSPPNYADWKRSSRSFTGTAAWVGIAFNLTGVAEPYRMQVAAVEPSLFGVLQVTPERGRAFDKADDPAIVLSHGLWISRFGGDAGVLGQRVLLDQQPYVVTGIMPETFQFPARTTEAWIPLRFSNPTDEGDRANNILDVVGRLAPGVTREQAGEELRGIAAGLERMYPRANEKTSAVVISLRDELSPQTRLLVGALFGAALCLLLIACTNLANVLLARALARRKELAIRAALGAGRERLVRQLLTESLLLAGMGGGLGVALAAAALPLLLRLVPPSLPLPPPSLDLRVLLFAVGLTVVTGLGFGVAPAVRACRAAAAEGLREGGRAGIGGSGRRLRSGLVVVEIGMSIVLLVAAGLLIRALWRVQAVDPGFRTEEVLTLRSVPSLPKYGNTERRSRYYERIVDEAVKLPGVRSAAWISFLPMQNRGGGIWPVGFGDEALARTESNTASLRFVTPGFLETLGIPLRDGRDVARTDTAQSRYVAVVSQSFADRYWPGESALGRKFRFGFAERVVVGVAGNIRVRGIERASEPQVYLPYQQVADDALGFYMPRDLVLRTSGDPLAVAPAVRRLLREIEPDQPVTDVRTLAEVVAADSAPRRVQILVLGSFTLVALVLAAIGIHGLLAFVVSQRTAEIGVRVALGARPADVLGMVLGETSVLTAAGVALGAAGGYAAAQSLAALLAGISPGDGVTYAAAIGLTVVMALAGSAVPAVRALRIDPATALRNG